ncbi:DUF695 domain-containing protein [Thalassobacterium sedimentorum]|nr:DUF695 domain-containing protein [Coraliomargarita sp. SDUM461004]
MKEFKVHFSEELFTLMEYREADLPAVMMLTTSLIDFESKEVFAWHLSIVIGCEDIAENGMPSKKEREEILEPFCDRFEEAIELKENGKPNALLLARITWNETRELVFRVFDPEVANSFLQKEIENDECERGFEFQMDHDPEWEKASWMFDMFRNAKPNQAELDNA